MTVDKHRFQICLHACGWSTNFSEWVQRFCPGGGGETILGRSKLSVAGHMIHIILTVCSDEIPRARIVDASYKDGSVD